MPGLEVDLRRERSNLFARRPGLDNSAMLELQVEMADAIYGASIVDPHGDHLADARAKLRARADFAEHYGKQFVRIESVTKVDGQLWSLDLLEADVRKAVREFEGGKVSALYESEHAMAYR